MEPVISVRGLSKSFDGFKAVDHLDLDVFKGDVFGFLGPNGAGKSTTIRMLLTLIRPDSGSISIFNEDIQINRKKILNRIGCIIEKPDFYKFLSARKNLELLARYNGFRPADKEIDSIIDFVGLRGRAHDKVAGFSHGMKQRLGIAQALLHDPELIILDEPTTGLDPQGIIDIRELILFLSREKGKTIFLSSHILHELELVSNRIAILNRGKLVVQGEMKSLLNDRDKVVEIKVDRPDEARTYLISSGHEVSSLVGSENALRMHLNENQIPLVIQGLVEKNFQIYSVATRRQLEDLFLQLTHSAERMDFSGKQ